MSTHNIGFYGELTKLSFNYHQISSNAHLICFSLKKTEPLFTGEEIRDLFLHINMPLQYMVIYGNSYVCENNIFR